MVYPANIIGRRRCQPKASIFQRGVALKSGERCSSPSGTSFVKSGMLENKQRFSHFAAIDWSGAKGSRHKGIAVALCGEGNAAPDIIPPPGKVWRSEEHTSELQSLMRISYAVFCLKKKKKLSHSSN